MPGKTHVVLSSVLALAFVFVFIVANASSSPHADSEEDAIFRAVFREVADRMVDDLPEVAAPCQAHGATCSQGC